MDIAREKSYPTPYANSSILPMLLLSLATQKHAPNTAKRANQEYDYVIVGAGSAGSVVASRLSEIPCVSVLLLEAGRSPPRLTEIPATTRTFVGTDIDWNYKTVPQKRAGHLLRNRQVNVHQGKTLGGSSILNDMAHIRGNRKNYDDWAAEGAKGWSYEEVLPYFMKLEDIRVPEFAANGYHGVGGPITLEIPRYDAEIKRPVFEAAKCMGYKVVDPNGCRQTGFWEYQVTSRAGQRCSTAKGYLVPADNRTNLDILPNAMVRKVLIKNRRAVGVEFDFEGKTHNVKARGEVILSAGTINTPQLLMLSGIGPKKELKKFKIPIVADLPVGQNLQDHVAAKIVYTLNCKIQPSLDKISNLVNIAEYIQNRTGPLTSDTLISIGASLKGCGINSKEDFPSSSLLLFESNSRLIQEIAPREVYEKVFAPYEGLPWYGCYAHPLQPRSRGTVTLHSTCPYDPPLIDPNYFEDPKDLQDLVEGLKVCNRISSSPQMVKLGTASLKTVYPGCEQLVDDKEEYLRCQAKSLIFSIGNVVGTARMGDPLDPRTVVDPQLRVKHVTGLRVVDASVMPIIPSGNTNIPTIMVAERASDIIKSTIKCHGSRKDVCKKRKTTKSPASDLHRCDKTESCEDLKNDAPGEENALTDG